MTTTQLPYPGVASAPRRLRDDLAAYLRRPRSRVDRGPLPDLTWAKMIALQLLSLIVAAPFMAVGFAIVSDREFVANDGISPIALLVLAVIVAPLLEEYAFRFAVVAYRPLFLVVGGLVFAAFLTTVVVATELPTPAKTVALAAVGAVALAVILLGVARSPRAAAFWESAFPWLFYGSAVIFGLMHLGNYSFGDIPPLAYLALPLLVTPQIIGGVLLGYTRVRLGILASIGQHAAYNFALVSIALLAGGP